MARLSVYIPDGLLERARDFNPDANTSQLVQRGLERLAPGEDAGYDRRPDDAAELLVAAAGKLREGAAREYEKGYRAALVTVSQAGEDFWLGVNDLAGMGFDLMRWAESFRQGAGVGLKLPDWYHLPLNDLGSMFYDPVGSDEYAFTRSRPFIRGYRAALRDAWDTAERPEASDAPGGNAGAVDGEEVAAPAI
jgi:hypothetical protein